MVNIIGHYAGNDGGDYDIDDDEDVGCDGNEGGWSLTVCDKC